MLFNFIPKDWDHRCAYIMIKILLGSEPDKDDIFILTAIALSEVS